MRYEILGPLHVVEGPDISSISARKVETVLAVLLIRAEQIVTAEQLMNEVWETDPPRRATSALHVYMSQLRKFLARPGRAGNPIVTKAPGYLLRIGRDEFDLHDFRQHMQRARSDARAQRHEESVRNLEGALSLWRGPALADLRDGPIVQGFVAGLEEIYSECLEMVIDSNLRLGRHRECIGQLYALTAEYPLRETFYRQLMLALYRSERKADALRVYGNAREVLRDELGLEPGQPLRSLHRAILTADDGLDLRRAG